MCVVNIVPGDWRKEERVEDNQIEVHVAIMCEIANTFNN